MDFTWTPEQEQFRREVAGFLARALPSEWEEREFLGDVGRDERREVTREVNRALASRAWLALPWRPELGGAGAGHLDQAIFAEEAAYARMPGGGGAGVAWVGPALMQHGTPEQQRDYLPRIASGEDTWCTLFTEAGAGSDLAAIETHAERRGDDWVISGAKRFVAGAQDATMGWLAARTDPGMAREQGLSIFMLPMDAPGVSMMPIEDIGGGNDLCDVVLDEVRVPPAMLVGEPHEGWSQVVDTRDLDRSGVGAFAMGKRHLERLVSVAQEEPSLLARSPGARDELAQRWIELQVGFDTAYRVPFLQSQGHEALQEAAISQIAGAELEQRIASTGVSLLGAAGGLAPGSRYARLGGAFSTLYLRATAATIAHGTSEVHRTTIAQRGLGLPRG